MFMDFLRNRNSNKRKRYQFKSNKKKLNIQINFHFILLKTSMNLFEEMALVDFWTNPSSSASYITIEIM